MARIVKSVARITCGLYYHHMMAPVPSNYVVVPKYLFGLGGPRRKDHDIQNDNNILKWLYDSEEHKIGGTVFCYKYREIAEVPKAVIWQFRFYHEIAFLSFVFPGANAT